MPAYLRKGFLEALVLDVLRHGPLPIHTVARRLNRNTSVIRMAMMRMADRGQIELYGTAGTLGIDASKLNARCFGLPRALPFGWDEADDGGDDGDAPQRPAAPRPLSKGSGVVAPAPYATGFRW